MCSTVVNWQMNCELLVELSYLNICKILRMTNTIFLDFPSSFRHLVQMPSASLYCSSRSVLWYKCKRTVLALDLNLGPGAILMRIQVHHPRLSSDNVPRHTQSYRSLFSICILYLKVSSPWQSGSQLYLCTWPPWIL